jgi:hypothetical protein
MTRAYQMWQNLCELELNWNSKTLRSSFPVTDHSLGLQKLVQSEDAPFPAIP